MTAMHENLDLQRSVLDQGYVRLIRPVGEDLEVANDARASFAKEHGQLTDQDIRLISDLARDGHQSPFRAQGLKLEVKAPLMVARQWWKYKVASQHIEEMESWNEQSRRYLTRTPEFYRPFQFRSAPAVRKQGSAGPMAEADDMQWQEALQEFVRHGLQLYKKAVKQGMCAEQARLFLPAYGMYTTWRWQVSLPSILHFYEERINHDAQQEIQAYAKAVAWVAEQVFPVAWNALIQHSKRTRATQLADRINGLTSILGANNPISGELRDIAEQAKSLGN